MHDWFPCGSLEFFFVIFYFSPTIYIHIRSRVLLLVILEIDRKIHVEI